MISPQDIEQVHARVADATAITDQVCGSTSLQEYRAHLDALGQVRDTVASCRNLVIKEKNSWSDADRELKRLLDKLDDHRVRVKAAYNDIRFSQPKQ